MVHPGGRPKKTLNDLPKDWKSKMLSLAGVGGADIELRVECLGGICHETWTRLIKEEDKFSETVKECKALCEGWWVRQGRIALRDKDFSPTLFYMNMKNRFNWRDKQDVTSDGERITSVEVSFVGKDKTTVTPEV